MAEVRAGQLPAPGAVDFQAVPLCLQKNDKGGENGTQLASLRQAPHFLQRIFLRAKRKPAPSTPEEGDANLAGGFKSVYNITVGDQKIVVTVEKNACSYERYVL